MTDNNECIQCRFERWLDNNKERLELNSEAVEELLCCFTYMIDDACIGWEYDYQSEWALPLSERIGIMLEFDPHIFDD